jgi:hypothetical protein
MVHHFNYDVCNHVNRTSIFFHLIANGVSLVRWINTNLCVSFLVNPLQHSRYTIA